MVHSTSSFNLPFLREGIPRIIFFSQKWLRIQSMNILKGWYIDNKIVSAYNQKGEELFFLYQKWLRIHYKGVVYLQNNVRGYNRKRG